MNMIKEITPQNVKCPKSAQCIAAACPSLFDANKENYIIIGKRLVKKNLTSNVKNKIGPGEIAIQVPKNLFNEL